MGQLTRAFPWENTSLGPPDHWPQSLQTAVRILLTSRFAMWLGWGPELVFLYNDAYGAMTLGKKHPWALGRPTREVWAEIWDDLEPRIATVMNTGVATWDEALMLFLERSDYTEETYHTFSYSPLADDSGAVAGMLCVVVEETDRVIGERRLSTLRELASGLSEASTEPEVLLAVERSLGANLKDLPFTLTYLVGEDGVTLRAATGIERNHPMAPATLDDDSIWPVSAVQGGPELVEHLEALGEALPTGAWNRPPRAAIITPIARQGQEAPAGYFVAGLNPFRLVDAEYREFIGLVAGQVAASLANARAYEEERRRAESLAELDRAKTVFFSNVSHEFRTPLTLMLGPAEEALADDETTPHNRERMTVVHRNALRLQRLVNTLLDFARIEAGRVNASFAPTDLGAITADLASSFRSAAERAGLRLVIDVEPGGAPIFIDHDMWEKIVLNLLSNAFKHTFEGEIAVGVRESANRAIVTVRDTGVGIAPDQLPHIFERFHRVPNAQSRTHEGTGIGLALVQELVRRHGGNITVSSVVGGGTTFRLELPTGSAHLPPDQVSDRAPDSAAIGHASSSIISEAMRWLPDSTEGHGEDSGSHGVAPANGARVLLADDNADMREYLNRLLTARGWAVTAVADGRAAWESALRDPPDLILSDVMMPGMDGFELLRALRDNDATRTVPVILLSARAGEDARVEGARAGADDYLVKPFSAAELVAKVGAHLSLARDRRAAAEAVRAAHDTMIKVLNQAPVAFCLFRGPEHRFVLANAGYRQFIGGRDPVGQTLADVIPETDAGGYLALLDGVYRTGEPYIGRGEGLLYDRDGRGAKESFFNFVYHPFIGSDGRPEGVIVVAVDVTDEIVARRTADQARRDAESARQVADAANLTKSQFLAAMSHELRTPLNAIAGYVQLIEMGVHGPVSAPQRDALARVKRSSDHLLSLINDVLNFAKIEAGRVEYDITELSVAAIVREVMLMVEPQMAAKQLASRVDVPDGITVTADDERLRQILLNLLSNAVKFTPRGRVDVSAATVGDRVAIRVTDSGVGIPIDRQQMIFDPFVQVHRDLTRQVEGTGLGLSISRDLARGMGGDLLVASEPGVGSEFTIMMPAGTSPVILSEAKDLLLNRESRGA